MRLRREAASEAVHGPVLTEPALCTVSTVTDRGDNKKLLYVISKGNIKETGLRPYLINIWPNP